MKHYIPISIVLCSALLSTIHAAENAPRYTVRAYKAPHYTVRPYQDSHDHAAVFALITSELASLAGKEKAEKENERLHTKLHNCLKNNEPMNNIKRKEGSFQNTLFFDQNTLACVVTYLIKKDDGNCFIDTICIKPEYKHSIYTNIVERVLHYARLEKAKYIEIFESKTQHEDEINVLAEMGFTETICNEKEPDSVTLKFNTSAGLPCVKSS